MLQWCFLEGLLQLQWLHLCCLLVLLLQRLLQRLLQLQWLLLHCLHLLHWQRGWLLPWLLHWLLLRCWQVLQSQPVLARLQQGNFWFSWWLSPPLRQLVKQTGSLSEVVLVG